MRILLLLFIMTLYGMVAHSQPAVSLQSLNIAVNVTEEFGAYDLVFVCEYNFPRIKMELKITNVTNEDIRFFGDESRDKFFVRYIYGGEEFIETCDITYHSIPFTGDLIHVGQEYFISVVAPLNQLNSGNRQQFISSLLSTLSVIYEQYDISGRLVWTAIASAPQWDSVTFDSVTD